MNRTTSKQRAAKRLHQWRCGEAARAISEALVALVGVEHDRSTAGFLSRPLELPMTKPKPKPKAKTMNTNKRVTRSDLKDHNRVSLLRAEIKLITGRAPSSRDPKHLAARLVELRRPVVTSVSMSRRAREALTKFVELERAVRATEDPVGAATATKKLGASELIRTALAELARNRWREWDSGGANAANDPVMIQWRDIALAFESDDEPAVSS